jgi:hypothetical protein
MTSAAALNVGLGNGESNLRQSVASVLPLKISAVYTACDGRCSEQKRAVSSHRDSRGGDFMG